MKENNNNKKIKTYSALPENNQKKINTTHCLFLSVHVCEGQTGTGQSVLIYLADLSVSLQSVINRLRWCLFQKLLYT